MKTLRLILGDQLDTNISSLRDSDKENDIIFMCEVWEEATYVKHHKKKIVFLFSAMRHFAENLKKLKHNIIYIKLDETSKKTSFFSEVKKIISLKKIEKIIVTFPGEYRVLVDIKTWEEKFQLPIEIREDDRYLCSIDEFKQWANTRKNLRMEFFYREMRKKYDILMNKSTPAGGKWNYDVENRQPPTPELSPSKPMLFKTDEITQEVIELVEKNFPTHFGEISPFNLAVTRQQALKQLKHFTASRLKYFGEYQDAMMQNEPFMYHSMISFYLNCGLLNPIECIEEAIAVYQKKQAPLNSVEAFVRQILGWREYVRGIYWLLMPKYKDNNFFSAMRKLPKFFWTGETSLNCLKQCINDTRHNAYAHHIQRLMVLGNFMLLTGINPKEVNEWYLIVYADAFEWVELPNVTGMVLFADGGVLASKPYAAGGAYINKMSNYCTHCTYNFKKKSGVEACPFNYLYWNFLIKNSSKLKNNPRLAMIYKVLSKMSEDKIRDIQTDSEKFMRMLNEDKT